MKIVTGITGSIDHGVTLDLGDRRLIVVEVHCTLAHADRSGGEDGTYRYQKTAIQEGVFLDPRGDADLIALVVARLNDAAGRRPLEFDDRTDEERGVEVTTDGAGVVMTPEERAALTGEPVEASGVALLTHDELAALCDEYGADAAIYPDRTVRVAHEVVGALPADYHLDTDRPIGLNELVDVETPVRLGFGAGRTNELDDDDDEDLEDVLSPAEEVEALEAQLELGDIIAAADEADLTLARTMVATFLPWYFDGTGAQTVERLVDVYANRPALRLLVALEESLGDNRRSSVLDDLNGRLWKLPVEAPGELPAVMDSRADGLTTVPLLEPDRLLELADYADAHPDPAEGTADRLAAALASEDDALAFIGLDTVQTLARTPAWAVIDKARFNADNTQPAARAVACLRQLVALEQAGKARKGVLAGLGDLATKLEASS